MNSIVRPSFKEKCVEIRICEFRKQCIGQRKKKKEKKEKRGQMQKTFFRNLNVKASKKRFGNNR